MPYEILKMEKKSGTDIWRIHAKSIKYRFVDDTTILQFYGYNMTITTEDYLPNNTTVLNYRKYVEYNEYSFDIGSWNIALA